MSPDATKWHPHLNDKLQLLQQTKHPAPKHSCVSKGKWLSSNGSANSPRISHLTSGRVWKPRAWLKLRFPIFQFHLPRSPRRTVVSAGLWQSSGVNIFAGQIHGVLNAKTLLQLLHILLYL